MKLHHALAAGALTLGVAFSAPVKAATVTDLVTFSDSGAYTIDGQTAYGYNGGMTLAGSFTITFDPTLLYTDQSISGVISGLTYTLTDSRFSPLTLNPITEFTFAYGTLDLFSNASAGRTPNGTNDIDIGINSLLWGGGSTGSSVWYSQIGFPDTVTSSGDATVFAGGLSATPLPSTWTMLIAGFLGLGFFAYRGSKKSASALTAA